MRRGGVHERHQRATLAAHDQRRETVEPRLPTGVEADCLREIDIAAEAGEAAVIPTAAPVMHTDPVLTNGAPVTDRRVAGTDDARLSISDESRVENKRARMLHARWRTEHYKKKK